jgi:hypothetical protein
MGSALARLAQHRCCAKSIRKQPISLPIRNSRPWTPLSLEGAKRLIQQYVDRCNNVRLHGAIGYVTPKDMLARLTGRDSH